MTDKDPRDMTVSEQLRWAANGEPYNGIDENIWTYPTGKIRALAEDVTGEWPSDNEIFSIVADKIDAELAQARRSGLERAAKSWAKANGWPDFKECEDFGAWLDRCFIPRPRFEDGEPVHIGDKAEHPYTGETCTIDCINTFDDSYCLGFVEERSASLCDGERVKRPAHEVLGADGKPIMVGDTVYGVNNGHRYTVMGLPVPSNDTIYNLNDDRLHLIHDESGLDAIFSAQKLTHTPPDTLERLRDDIAEWRADCANPGSGWDVKTAEWADRIDAIIRRTGGAE